jgi:hypothetical protein
MTDYPKLPYLKEHLQTNIPVVVTISKRVGQYPETDFNTKQPTGKMQTLYNFTLPTGQAVRHYAKEREEEVLSLFSAGEEVQVVLAEGKNENTGARFTYPVWTPKEGAEARAAANPQPMSNTRQTATQNELKEQQQHREEKDIQIALQGFAQAYIIQGMDIDKALESAVIARKKLIAKAGEVYHGITMPTPSVSIDTVNEAFGDTPPPPNSPADYE